MNSINSKTRARILYGLIGALLLYWGADWAYGTYVSQPLTELNDDIAAAEAKKTKLTRQVKNARKLGDRLLVLESQSLPADVELARSLYRQWLLERVVEAGFASPNVDSGAAVSRRGYQSLPFSVKGRATLDQFTRLLHDFYQADHLHQIRTLSLVPIASQGTVDVSLSIEALILPDAPAEQRLNTRKSETLASATLADYRPLVSRDVFGLSRAFSPASKTSLTGIIAANGKKQAWFTLPENDAIEKRSEGQTLEVGDFRGTIVEIERTAVTIESGGERWQLSIGDNLDKGIALLQEP